MNLSKDAKRVGIWGGSGSGKSTRLKELTRTDNRLIVLDPIGDWEQERGFKSYKTLRGLYSGIRAGWNTGFRLVYLADKGLPELLQEISRALFVIQQPYFKGEDTRKISLAIDEMADFYPNKTLSAADGDFQKLCRKGRHYGVNIYGVSQRLAEVHPSFRGNAEENYYFRQNTATDVNNALQSLGSQHKTALLGLQPHHYLHNASGKVSKGINEFELKRV